MEALVLTAIAAIGVSSISTRALLLSEEKSAWKHDIGKVQVGSPTEQSRRKYAQSCPTFLLLGNVLGVAISFSSTFSEWDSPRRAILGAWIILGCQSGVLVTEKTATQHRFSATLFGAASSAILTVYHAFNLQLQVAGTKAVGHNVEAAGFVAAALTLYGFFSIPRQPDLFYQGRLVDRQLSASILERTTFSWSRTLFSTEIISKSKVTDLPVLPLTARARYLTRRHIQNIKRRQNALGASLAWTYAGPLALQWSLTVIKSIVVLGPNFVTFYLLRWLEYRARDGDNTRIHGLLLALALGASEMVKLWISSWLQWLTASKLQIPMKATLSSLIYDKALRLPNVLDAPKNTGSKSSRDPRAAIITHMQIDSVKACMVYTDTRIPLTIAKLASNTFFLVKLIGWKCLLPGLLASILALPLSNVFTQRYNSVQAKQRKHRDRRVSLIKDALFAIRQLKMSATEATWEAKIFDARKHELQRLLRSAIWMSCLVFTANISPILLAGIPICLFAIQNKGLNAPVAFTCIDLFQQLQSDLSILPLTTAYLSDALSHLRRLETFLSNKEISRTGMEVSSTVFCEHATIAWSGENMDAPQDSRFLLKNVSAQFPSGQLSLVTGETGSGKSLLISALAGEATIISGAVHNPSAKRQLSIKLEEDNAEYSVKHGQLAIVSQYPWIENTTVRDNILFGLPMDGARYAAVLYSCALQTDLKGLEEGDATQVGPRGAALSGGQKWRIALARALYSEAGVILLEDILGAVDAEVRGWLVEEALCGKLAEGRTRVLATHHPEQCQSKAAYVVQLHGGKVALQRHLSPTVPTPAPAQAQRLDHRQLLDLRQNGNGVKESFSRWLFASDTPLPPKDISIPPTQNKEESSPDGRRGKWEQSLWSSYPLYKTYFHATGGLGSWVSVLVVLVVCELSNFAKSWWLKNWTSHMQLQQSVDQLGEPLPGEGKDNPIVFYGSIFMAISCLSCLATATRCFVWFWIGIRASTKLFRNMTHSVFTSPLLWLEGTPHGEITTRFASDMNTIDQRLPHDVGYMVECLSQVASIAFACTSSSATELAIIGVLLYAYCKLGARLVFATRALKNLNTVATASLAQQLSSLLAPDGVLTIRSFGMSDYFMDRMFQYIDDASSTTWHHSLCQVMMDFQSGVLGALLLTSIAIGAVLNHADAGATAIALSFATRFGGTISGFLRRIATVEAGLDSVKRIAQYEDLPAESESGLEPPSAWPSKGHVQVHNLTAGYQEAKESPTALKNISFSVKPGERLGIVGRTGAGKSSLTLAFARLLHQRQGDITIDEIDVSTLKPRSLRQRLFIIPQDPYLSPGPLRSILDPNGSYDNDSLVNVLQKVGFASPIGEGSGSVQGADLSLEISGGGANISQGQRQILCLARALLSRPPIVIMDESTSAVDVGTDAIIQKALQEGLPASTVIVVAHRLATVAEFDKILVLDHGTMVEFGAPADLCNRKGWFWNLVRHSSDREQLLSKIFGQADSGQSSV